MTTFIGTTGYNNTPTKNSKPGFNLYNKLCEGRFIWLAVSIISLSQLSFSMKYRYTSFPINNDTRKNEDTYRYDDDDVRTGEKYAIFYHAYIDPENVTYSLGIVEEQLAQWQESRYAGVTLYYTQLGDSSSLFPCQSDAHCKLLTKNSIGWERSTLVKISKYCQQYPDRNVIYLHSKGTFHPSEENNRSRKVLTSSAFSDQCHQGLHNTQCNVCSARFSTVPHWHTPGNMWTARCSYINKLLYPSLNFEARVAEVVSKYKPDLTRLPPACVGTERFADEHWVHTHPHIHPCDVYPDLDWMYGYKVLDVDLPLELFENAPRDFGTPKKDIGPHVFLKYRLYELQNLYGMTPPKDSFVWTWYEQAKLPGS